MTHQLHARLAWLPPPPHDFSAQCRSLLDDPVDLGTRLQRLAQHGLDENQLDRLARVIHKARATGCLLAPLVPFCLGILSNATSHFVVPALVATAARHGIALQCVDAGYGQGMQAALADDSPLNQARCDAVLVALDHRGLPLPGPVLGNAPAAEQAVQRALAHLAMIGRGLHSHGHAVCLWQTLACPAESLFGSFDRSVPGTPRELIDAFNRALVRQVAGSGDVLFDVAHIAETVGLADWHDPTLWNLAKLPFANSFVPLYADHVGRLLAAVLGKSRKCLVLDLDNTLWGGVIGDDGLQGIVLGEGDATGEAYLQLQRTALALRERGVVLAVSSKNHDAVARSPFRQHPEMLLREEHVAVFQANWSDKAANLEAIAHALSLGLESMVLLDDNPAERGLVRQMLPQVAVPELPADPALFARTLLAAGYFESINYSGEDRGRAECYQQAARRVSLQTQAADVQAYLASLQMQMTLLPFDETARARIAQLINKSNQFNLTARRYTEAEVAAAQHDPDVYTLQVRLSDTFGDNGMISVVICRRREADWHIDTWLMSCRVLGRRVEAAVLQELVAQARVRGIRRLVGRYRPSGRNQLVADHYDKLGFTLVETGLDGATQWQRHVQAEAAAPLPFVVQRSLDEGSAR